LRNFPSKDAFYYILEHSELRKCEMLPSNSSPSFPDLSVFSGKHRFIQPGPPHSGNSQQGTTLAQGLERSACPETAEHWECLALLVQRRCRASWAGVRPGQVMWSQTDLHTFGDGTPTAASTDETPLLLDQCYYNWQGTKSSTQKTLSCSHKQR